MHSSKIEKDPYYDLIRLIYFDGVNHIILKQYIMIERTIIKRKAVGVLPAAFITIKRKSADLC